VPWASFLPNFSFLCPVVNLGSGTGQTDNSYQCISPSLWGWGIIHDNFQVYKCATAKTVKCNNNTGV